MAYLSLIDPKCSAYYITFVGGKVKPVNGRPLSEVPLRDKTDVFFKYVEEHFSNNTLIAYKWMVKRVLCERRSFFSYNKLFDIYRNNRTIKSYLVHVLLFDFFDLMPDSGRIDFSFVYYSLSETYQNLIRECLRCLLSGKLQERTINVSVSITAKFFKYLMSSGVFDIHSLTESVIRDFGSDTYELYRVKLVLTYYAEMFSDNQLQEILKWFPPALHRKKVYSAMSDAELNQLVSFLLDPDSAITKRDRAIGLLLYYTGMRSIDVQNLARQNISIAKQSLSFLQHKTGVHVVLPLRPVVYNAIVDYVANERKKVQSDLLFLPDRIPRDGKIKHCNISRVVNQIYTSAKIRNEGRRGTHILRHALANKLTNEGVDISIVSRILGHTNPNTTWGYISSNIDQLRACALSIVDYPIQSKLYEIKDS